MRFPGFIGPSYVSQSLNFDCERSVNLYAEINENRTGKAGEVACLRSRPGLTKILEIGDGPIRCIVRRKDGVIIAISGNKAYRLSESSGVWSSALLSDSGAKTLSTSSGIVKAASAVSSTGLDVTVFVDGTMNCVYYIDPPLPDPMAAQLFSRYDSLGWPGVPDATHIVYIDGYLIFNEQGTSNFWISDLGNPLSVSPLDFASAEGNPDNIEAVIANNRDLWLFGENTTEVFTNTGNADFPFERISGGFNEFGILAKYSIDKINGSIYWLGKDEKGQAIVYSASGMVPQRISTHAIETAIEGYDTPEEATGFCYQTGGHFFYQLNFSEMTWVYDISTNLWHEQAFTESDGSLSRHRGDVMCFDPETKKHIVGDYESNKIYVMDNSIYKDDTSPLTRMRITPHVSSESKLITCNSFQLDIEAGVGLDGGSSVQGSDPQAMLQWSDDGGHTWSSEHWRSFGKLGERAKRVIWRRLGMFRDRVFKIKITDPVKVTILGAEIEFDQGSS